MDTIFARSSGVGKAGITIYRISGTNSLHILKILSKNQDIKDFVPNKIYKQKLFNPETDELIDEAMVVFFKAPHSFTGEDTVELHLHGSIAIDKIIIQVLSHMIGTRLAEKGEFAKRAFFNGKFDLTSAEGLADLIDAETSLQHKQAIRQYSGGLENLYDNWRSQALKIISLLEAYIDFPEEEIPTNISEQAKQIVEQLITSINKHLNDNKRGERLKNGIKVSIIGKPNVGKSSLLNFLLARDVAIVSSIPGTTRDVIEGHLDIEGYPIIFQDTAGIRENSADLIEQEGMKRALSIANQADLILFISDIHNSQQELDEVLNLIKNNNVISVINKIDLLLPQQVNLLSSSSLTIYVSIKNQVGLDMLINSIVTKCKEMAGITEDPSITRIRYRNQLEQALIHLNNFLQNENDIVLACEDIRLSVRALSNIMGKISVEEILGEIFHNFCIGK